MLPAYRREGSGPALVCHPGGPGFSSLYFTDLAGLGAVRELVLVDPRGTGATPAPADPRAYAIEDYVGDLEELRLAFGLDTVDLLGHSHGGVVAIAYASSHPERVRRLVLASTLARWAEPQVHAMEAGIAARAGEPWYADGVQALADEQAGRFSSADELAALVLREYPFYFARYGPAERAYTDTIHRESPNPDALKLFNEEIFPMFDLRPGLGAITAETLVITGRDDFITGPVCAEEIAGGIAGAELQILERCGHFLFVERRDEFRQAVERFLRR